MTPLSTAIHRSGFATMRQETKMIYVFYHISLHSTIVPGLENVY